MRAFAWPGSAFTRDEPGGAYFSGFAAFLLCGFAALRLCLFFRKESSLVAAGAALFFTTPACRMAGISQMNTPACPAGRDANLAAPLPGVGRAGRPFSVFPVYQQVDVFRFPTCGSACFSKKTFPIPGWGRLRAFRRRISEGAVNRQISDASTEMENQFNVGTKTDVAFKAERCSAFLF